jgi:phosphoribosylaminoimidazole synthetase
MPPVQDHKRLLDGDSGPNTGGMGTFAPSPYAPPALIDELVRSILQPAVDGLREEGKPFVGALYAGLILTPEGPRVLEFNCRFGDPETQALMPLLDADLAEICLACAEGRLAELAPRVRWRSGAAACVVLASDGYPEQPRTGQEICGLEDLAVLEDTCAFHAGTVEKNGRLLTAGGRVLGITAWAETLEAAVEKAYTGVAHVRFEGMQFRRDIGRPNAGSSPNTSFGEAGSPGSGVGRPNAGRQVEGKQRSAYETAGVSIDAGTRAVHLMRQAVRSTFTPQVLSDVGAFGGLYRLAGIRSMRDPVLVASTDGIGTKVDLAARVRRYRGLGHDIVNHCLNDILVQGAQPLFFLDYVASGRLDPEMVAELVAGMSEACRLAGCALLGGETAEMPGIYAEGHFDVAGTIVGVVEREAILPRRDIRPGDLLLGLASSGPHTNGYSLLRRIFAGELEKAVPESGVPVIDALLEPHRSYLPLLAPLLPDASTPGSPIKALAHLTGGGFIDNLPRVLPDGCGVSIRRGSWPVPPLFSLAQRLGQVDEGEMFRVFNMGIGMIAILSPQDLPGVQAAIPEPTWVIGEVVQGQGVRLEKGA